MSSRHFNYLTVDRVPFPATDAGERRALASGRGYGTAYDATRSMEWLARAACAINVLAMKSCLTVVLLFAAAFQCAATASSLTPETLIRFDTPAANFTESTPLGNGRLGAMMFGGVDQERIVLNENSVWSGSRQDADRPDAYKALPEIQRLLLEGKNSEAEALVNAHFVCRGPGSSSGTGDGQFGCYQTLGNLRLSFSGDTNTPVENYRRELDLNDAVARLGFIRGGVAFSREMFVSWPDQVMVLHLSADRPGAISFDARLDRPERFATTGDGENGLLMTGQLNDGLGGKGISYVARIRVLARGGQTSVHENVLSVSKADEVTLLIAAATNYQGIAGRQTKDPLAATLDDLNNAAKKSYDSLRQAHVADYQKYFQRVSLQLGPGNSVAATQPTSKRIETAAEGSGDPSLAALYFNFGRYLLISSSRPGGLPANLQGIWAEEIRTPWTGDWHLDMNVEMNYWPAEVCNLSDLTEPLFALINSLQVPGAKTAHEYYNAQGWVAHVITNPWGFTSPGEVASWGSYNGGSAWLCQHLYDHYLFTHDRKFLEWAYPILKGAARFYSDVLIEEPKHHWLVIAPSNSPENHFKMPDGADVCIALGPTMVQQQVRYLFTACIESAEILGTDDDFRKELMAKRARLAPTQIGSDGRILEWLAEYKESDPHHRHVSHLWGLHPGNEISPYTTPELAKAARKSLDVRGDLPTLETGAGGIGWSLACKAALRARLGEGNNAWRLVQKALEPAFGTHHDPKGSGGVYANLFDVCPPFQIDGNFGITAAISEMLLQSDKGVIYLLPALPDAWKQGKVTGLRARGGFEVSMIWNDGKLTSAIIRSDQGEPCRVRYNATALDLKLGKGEGATWDGNLTVKP
jgi:alpha-L-fucosidase 2